MNPLSTINYLKKHKKKVSTDSFIIGLSIFLILFMQVEVRGLSDGFYLSSERLNFFSEGKVKTESDSEKIIDNQMKEDGVLEKTIPSIKYGSSIKNNIGIDMELVIYKMSGEDIKYTIDKLGLKVKEGNLGTSDGKSIILSERVANNKGVKVGDKLSKDNDDFFKIDGEYTVACILEGNVNLGFIQGSKEGILESSEKNYLYFWKEGFKNKVNSILLANKGSDFQVTDYDTDIIAIEDFAESFTLMSNIIIVLLVIIQGVILAFTSYLEYYQRREEFGIEKALGFKEKNILINIFKEIFIRSVLGFFIGIILACMYIYVINCFVFQRGLPPYRIIFDDILKVTIFPIVITLSSVLPIAKLIRNTDTIKIIEGGA
jgi:putative ABC transport system permease protein